MLEPVRTIELFQKPPDPQIFAPGSPIFQAGERGEVMYGVISGEVEIIVNGKVVETILPGDIFGEGAIVHLDRQRASTAIAKTDSLLGFLEREHFMLAVEQTPMFALEVMKSDSDRLRRLRRIVSVLEGELPNA